MDMEIESFFNVRSGEILFLALIEDVEDEKVTYKPRDFFFSV